MATMNRRAEVPEPKKIEVVERKLPEVPEDGALVKIHYAGICHTDVHILDDECDLSGSIKPVRIPKELFPFVMGHEIAGEIHSFGKNVKPEKAGMKIGDLVMVYPWGGCRKCSMCEKEEYVRCPKLMENSHGVDLPGGFQQYVEVKELDRLVPVPDGVPMDVASLLPCSGITAYSAIINVVQSVKDHISVYGKASLLIVGAGGVGLWGVQIAKELMPPGTKIIVAEAHESKFEYARKAGADETVLWPSGGSAEDNIAAVRKLAPEGVAGAVDFVGATITNSSIFGCLAMTSTMVMIGLLGGDMKFSIPIAIARQNVIKGVLVGDPEHMRQMARLVAAGKVKSPPITHVKLEDAGRVLEELRAGTSRGRNIIKLV